MSQMDSVFSSRGFESEKVVFSWIPSCHTENDKNSLFLCFAIGYIGYIAPSMFIWANNY